MSNGTGCKCFARGEFECCCDGVDWTPQEVLDLRAENTKLRRERDEARRMYCVMAANVMYKSENKSTAEHIANEKNWDCYKTETQEETK
jgi:hypothetical protein